MTTPPRGARVLVIDDHEVIRELLARSVQALGYEPTTAPSGPAGLALLQEQPFDLILLDMAMPLMSGVEVLQRLKAQATTRDVPVIVISADSDTDRIAACINLGAEDYLIKPFNAVILSARVSTCLERYRLRLNERSYQTLLEDRVAERTALAEQRAMALELSQAELRHQSSVLESILASMGDGVVVVDRDRALVHHNPAAVQILGDRLTSLLPCAPAQQHFFYPDRLNPCPVADLPLAQAIQGREIDGMELYVAAPLADAAQWLSITARPLRDAGGAISGAVAVIRDVSAAKRSELALRESEARYALAARGANDGLWDWDLRSQTVYYSARWQEMLGYHDGELGASSAEWLGRVHPDDREHLEVRLAAHWARLISHFEHEYRIMHRDGAYRWMLCRGLAIWDEAGQAVRIAGSQTDITDRKQAEARLIHDALHDTLTSLPNRALFIDRLDHAIAMRRRGNGSPFAVLFIDLDRFKVINDSLGHVVGDELLVTIARRLEGSLRAGDTIARLGGDEFTILLEEIGDAQQIQEIADRIQATIAQPLRLGGQQVFTTASIGVVIGNEAYHSAAEIVRDADTAMYHAKFRGKAQAIFFEPTMHTQMMSQLQLEADLRRALERDEFQLHYQPIVALETGAVVGVEALVRWEHPQRGLIYPGEFLHIAEETGLIVQLSWWTLRTACAQLRLWQELPAGQQLWVSVNFSSRQLTQPQVVRQVAQILSETGVGPGDLKLEITEHTLIELSETTMQALTELRQLGVQVCIDDFGTGYSSLSYLQRFPIDVLKIDRSFISQIGKRGEIVQTILSLAQMLGIQAVAEGTETQQQLEELRRLDCEYGQGWLFSKAIDPAAFSAMLRARRSLSDPAPITLP